MDITELLAYTQKHHASDLHLTSGMPPLVRVHGSITTLNVGPLSAEDVANYIHSVMTDKQRSQFELEMEVDFAIHFGEASRFRVNAFNTINGPAAVFRHIPSEIKTLGALMLPEVLQQLMHLQKGLVLVTGPTGSGKSTTLAAMVDYINSQMDKHILTIEDPVEFVHVSKKSLVNQRELGESTTSFSQALKSALREDPDVILVGEMRDLETIHLALTAAETGHLVLGTMHTSSAAKTVDRIIDVFPADDKEMIRAMVSGSLEAVIAQRLLRREDEEGRIACLEILLATPAVRNLIRDNKIPQIFSLMQVGSQVGMCTMRDSVNALLVEGKISDDTARSVLQEVGAMVQEQSRSSSDAGGKESDGAGVF